MIRDEVITKDGTKSVPLVTCIYFKNGPLGRKEITRHYDKINKIKE